MRVWGVLWLAMAMLGEKIYIHLFIDKLYFIVRACLVFKFLIELVFVQSALEFSQTHLSLYEQTK